MTQQPMTDRWLLPEGVEGLLPQQAEYLEQLADIGFKLIVVVSGHYGPPHIAALVEAANLFTIWQTQYDTRVWIIPEYDLVTDLGYRGDRRIRPRSRHPLFERHARWHADHLVD